MTELRYDVLVSDGVRRQQSMRLPDGGPIVSSPLASTLILGQTEAVLVDPPFTREQVHAVGDWIEQWGKRLAYIYATHGHGDHWFGTDLLMRRFPGAVPYATEGTIRLMHKQTTEGREQMWDVDDDTTVLHVPSIGLVVAGDVAYNGAHQYLLESVGGGIKKWLTRPDPVSPSRLVPATRSWWRARGPAGPSRSLRLLPVWALGRRRRTLRTTAAMVL
ncbi:MBL fold metallo-hydrolase [Nonomuraea sp. CA-141351]|uniref:MBL fold metallo-hydrolase n=1 Tax=Nonomuraea sp. CA-141351 TaxID=3239996 RepID=UPI003D8B323F